MTSNRRHAKPSLAAFNRAVVSSSVSPNDLADAMRYLSTDELLSCARMEAAAPSLPTLWAQGRSMLTTDPVPGHLAATNHDLVVVANPDLTPYRQARDAAANATDRFVDALESVRHLLEDRGKRMARAARSDHDGLWRLIERSHEARTAIVSLIEEASRLAEIDTWLPEAAPVDAAAEPTTAAYLLIDDILHKGLSRHGRVTLAAVGRLCAQERALETLVGEIAASSNSSLEGVLRFARIAMPTKAQIDGGRLAPGGEVYSPEQRDGALRRAFVAPNAAKRYAGSEVEVIYKRAAPWGHLYVLHMLDMIGRADDLIRTAIEVEPGADLSDGGRGYATYATRQISATASQTIPSRPEHRTIGSPPFLP